MKKILIIEDEENIRELISYNLSNDKYQCVLAEDGAEGLELARREKPDLILLDVMLPSIDGYEICKTLRKEENRVPIIMITAKNDEIDKVLGLEFGADDYISKPFGIRELQARIKAVMRRSENLGNGDREKNASEKNGRVIKIKDLSIDPDRREVSVDGDIIELTLKEFELLHILAKNRGNVLSRDQILDIVWGYEYVGETRTVDVHVRYLRKKLGALEGDGKYVQTVRGVGYKIV